MQNPTDQAVTSIPTKTVIAIDSPILLTVTHIIMQNPTDQAVTSIPMETVIAINSLILNRALSLRHTKPAKRTLPWKLTADETQLALPPAQNAVPRRSQRARAEIDRLGDYVDTSDDLQRSYDVREKKKRPRLLEEPVPTSADEAATTTTANDTTVALPAAAAADSDHHHADSDLVMAMHPDMRTSGGTGRWTLEEDAKLTSAVTKTCKKKHDKEQGIDWAAVAALVLGRTKTQCRCRWRDGFDIARASGRTGKWTKDEYFKLKKAVEAHGGKNWGAISALVPGRTKKQCWNKWKDVLDPNLGTVSGRKGKWTAVEDSWLTEVVRKYGGKKWHGIAAMVPGRSEKQCRHRWNDFLDPSIGAVSGGMGIWTVAEDWRLRDAVQAHGGKDWAAIAALLPGRTKRACGHRWKKHT
jgi:hypothetical protein